MSSESEHASSANAPLLPNGSDDVLSGIMPCAEFLFESKLDEYYKGGIYKKYGLVEPGRALVYSVSMVANIANGFRDFFSYKFEHSMENIPRTFCITFRKKFFTSKHKWLGDRKNDIDKYHIRLSLIEKHNNQYNNRMKCEKESMILDSNGELAFLPGAVLDEPTKIVFVPDSTGNSSDIKSNKSYMDDWINKSFSSITSGHNVGFKENSIVKGMQVITDEYVPEYIKEVVKKIIEKIDRLGKLLVYHCELLEQLATTSGGATRKINRLTRRRKSVFKRKGKKSYRKKKYGKTKKSRRFRRSVRSRR